MADALKYFREDCEDESLRGKFIGSEATEEFIRRIDSFFDIANTRTPETGITKKNWSDMKKVRYYHFDILLDKCSNVRLTFYIDPTTSVPNV